MRSLRSALLPLLILSTAASANDRVETGKLPADAIAAAFAPATSDGCASASEPCAAPTSSAVTDFAKLVRDVLDGRAPQALRFAETGMLFELRGEFDHVREAGTDGGERRTQRARGGQARYGLHQPEIVVRKGHVRFDQRDYPYHGTFDVKDGVESRYYCVDYPHHCVVLEFPLESAEPGSMILEPSPGTVGVQWFNIAPEDISQRTQVVDEKRWSGWLGTLTDQRDAANLMRSRIDYVGILRMTAGNGSPISAPESDWLKFGSAGCMVTLTLDAATRSIALTEVFACDANSTGSRLDIGSAQLGGAVSSERPSVAASRIVAPMQPPAVGYTATIRPNDISTAPLTTVTDRWQAVHGAIFGASGESLVMTFAGANSAFTISALRKDLVLDGEDLNLSREALIPEPVDETDDPLSASETRAACLLGTRVKPRGSFPCPAPLLTQDHDRPSAAIRSFQAKRLVEARIITNEVCKRHTVQGREKCTQSAIEDAL